MKKNQRYSSHLPKEKKKMAGKYHKNHEEKTKGGLFVRKKYFHFQQTNAFSLN